MRPTHAKHLLVALTLTLAACQAKSPEPAKAPEPAQPTAEKQVEPEQASPEQTAVEPEKAAERPEEATEEEAATEDGEAVAKDSKSADLGGAKKEKKALAPGKKTGDMKNVAMSGEAGKITVGAGKAGLGMRGVGRGGGGSVGQGRIVMGSLGAGRGVALKGATAGGSAYGSAAPVVSVPAGGRHTKNTESYANYGVNQMTSTKKDAKSTFAIDVDTGAYTIARKKLNAGTLPPKSSVRVEEFVNYFRYDYPDPDSGPFGVFMEAAPSPFSADENRKVLRVGVQGKRVTKSSRKPVHLTFLVDVSGSMSSPDKLGLAQKSLDVLTDNLRKGDTVAIATYAGRVAKILDPTGMDRRGRIKNAINSLRSGGSTAMNDGLELAYKLALANFERDHVNRVIVLSDGDANVGPHSHQDILKRIKHYVDEGVTLSTIGFGMGNYKDTMMEQLANKGNGNYYYIDTIKEARKVFGEQLDGTLQVIAKDVKIQVEFDPKTVKSYRLIGYENRDIADKDFRNDKVDAGEIGAGHTVTALYELVLEDGDAAKKLGKLGTVRIRHKKPDAAKASEQAFSLTRSDVHDKLQDASKDFQFATAVAGFAEILRKSKYAKNLSFDLIEEVAKAGTIAGQADREEFIKLVEKAKALQKS